MIKRLLGIFVGIIYAVIYGFWTMMITGAGQGNYLWLTLFIFTYYFGIFFPVAGFLIADLKPRWARISLGAVLGVHLFSVLVYFGFMVDDLIKDDRRGLYGNMLKSWKYGPDSFILFSAIHVFPVLLVLAIFIWSLVSANRKTAGSNDQQNIISVE